MTMHFMVSTSLNRTDDHQTSLQLAVKHNLPVVVDALCLRGADMNATDDKGDCPLWTALQAGW